MHNKNNLIYSILSGLDKQGLKFIILMQYIQRNLADGYKGCYYAAFMPPINVER